MAKRDAHESRAVVDADEPSDGSTIQYVGLTMMPSKLVERDHHQVGAVERAGPLIFSSFGAGRPVAEPYQASHSVALTVHRWPSRNHHGLSRRLTEDGGIKKRRACPRHKGSEHADGPQNLRTGPESANVRAWTRRRWRRRWADRARQEYYPRPAGQRNIQRRTGRLREAARTESSGRGPPCARAPGQRAGRAAVSGSPPRLLHRACRYGPLPAYSG